MPNASGIYSRRLSNGDILALRMSDGGHRKAYNVKVIDSEFPIDLQEFSLGSASALAAAGTGWSLVQDSSSNNLLEPGDDWELYQVFYGIHPSYAWIYRRYPGNVDRGSLRGTRATGGQTGYVSGAQSPLRCPSERTEVFTLKGGGSPSYFGYLPYAEPSSVTMRMSFYIGTYYLEKVDVKTLSNFELARVKPITFGGRKALVVAPSWLSDAFK